MKVEFADTFFKSLKRLSRQQTWWYKTYSTIRYDIPHFIKNIYRFRKELYSHDWWDYRFTLNMLERSLTIMENGMTEKGIEVGEMLEPKLKSMRRALELLKNSREDNFVDRAEAELGELILSDWLFEETEDGFHKLVDTETKKDKAHNRRIFKRAVKIEQDEWNELWNIIKGTKNSKKYDSNYDGTDMRAWWD
jgi:mRNA-degrading endonuclease RelE of RelBE toxin-antitoxin system